MEEERLSVVIFIKEDSSIFFVVILEKKWKIYNADEDDDATVSKQTFVAKYNENIVN